MIEIYTDGSCLTNPGNGGWAAIINDDGKIKKISGSEKDTTNNRMELLAPINALKKMDASLEINIYTDSQYVKLGITEWINKWIINNIYDSGVFNYDRKQNCRRICYSDYFFFILIFTDTAVYR